MGHRRRLVTTAAAALAIGLSACGFAGQAGADDPPALEGTWSPSDGTSEKVFDAAGNCRGFFYSNGKPLDIGGPMSCQLSTKPDSSGQFRLLVTQGPNRATYLVSFDGADAANVYAKNGTLLYNLTRF